MSVEIDLDDQALDHLLNDIDGPVGDMLERVCADGAEQARRLAPVDTGDLQDSISHRVRKVRRGLVGRVFASDRAATFKELGTRYQPAEPYLRPGVLIAIRRI